MRTAGILLIVFSGVWLSLKIYLSHTRRISLLKQLLSDAEVLKNEVIFKKSTLYNALSKVKNEGTLREFYEMILKELKEGEGVRESFLRGSEVLAGAIKKEDISVVSDFGRLLGSTDIEGQITAFEIFIRDLEKNLKEAEKSKKEKMKSECAAVIFGFTAVALIVM